MPMLLAAASVQVVCSFQAMIDKHELAGRHAFVRRVLLIERLQQKQTLLRRAVATVEVHRVLVRKFMEKQELCKQ